MGIRVLSWFLLSFLLWQEVWLDRVTGRVCMSISAKGLAITGIEDRRYWNWIPTEESRSDYQTQALVFLGSQLQASSFIFLFFFFWGILCL